MPPVSRCARETRFDWTGDRRPHHESDTVIYEMHVRGFTQNPSSGVCAGARGTYLGVIEKIPYLKDLGIGWTGAGCSGMRTSTAFSGGRLLFGRRIPHAYWEPLAFAIQTREVILPGAERQE